MDDLKARLEAEQAADDEEAKKWEDGSQPKKDALESDGNIIATCQLYKDKPKEDEKEDADVFTTKVSVAKSLIDQGYKLAIVKINEKK